MTQTDLRIALVFSADDQGWIRRSSIDVPKFWQGHGVAPALGDIVRVGGRQFIIEARVWEHEGGAPLLRLFVGSGRAQSDTSFGLPD
jgi:hypothetical protein